MWGLRVFVFSGWEYQCARLTGPGIELKVCRFLGAIIVGSYWRA